MSNYRRSLNILGSLLPDALLGRLDLMIPGRVSTWGGAFNGQRSRRRLLIHLAALMEFDFCIETGTYRGTTTLFLADVLNVPVWTIEANLRFSAFAQGRFNDRPDITVVPGRSEVALEHVIRDALQSGNCGFFYLDAHWQRELPLQTEVSLICSFAHRSIIMVDDFVVPQHPEYGFDCYEGACLNVSLLPRIADSWFICFPTCPPSQETGERRGTALLFGLEHVPTFRQMTGVTPPVSVKALRGSANAHKANAPALFGPAD